MMSDQKLNSVFLFKLELTSKQFKKYKNRIFQAEGIDITSDQWILLKNISEEEGINQKELADKCKKEAASVTRTLNILERKAWVNRASNPDSKRVYNLFLTKEGRKMIDKILPIALKTRQAAKAGISDEELLLFNNVLDKIFKNLK